MKKKSEFIQICNELGLEWDGEPTVREFDEILKCIKLNKPLLPNFRRKNTHQPQLDPQPLDPQPLDPQPLDPQPKKTVVKKIIKKITPKTELSVVDPPRLTEEVFDKIDNKEQVSIETHQPTKNNVETKTVVKKVIRKVIKKSPEEKPIETPKVEEVVVETPKVEEVVVETPKVEEVVVVETPKVEEVVVETPKVEEVVVETPKVVNIFTKLLNKKEEIKKETEFPPVDPNKYINIKGVDIIEIFHRMGLTKPDILNEFLYYYNELHPKQTRPTSPITNEPTSETKINNVNIEYEKIPELSRDHFIKIRNIYLLDANKKRTYQELSKITGLDQTIIQHAIINYFYYNKKYPN